MDALLTAVQAALAPENILAISAGTAFGLIFGAIPGLTFSVALAIILPFTFALEPSTAIALLLSTYIGGMTGGSVSAILLGIPGTPSAAATVADGQALAKQGKASLALGLAVIVSTFGGLVSLIIMMASVDLVARMAIRFGPAEIFALVLFGFSTICAMAEKSLLKGLIAGALGLMIMTIGLDEF
ncbi:MAG TPA: tripartite tricarboxylate transporter permease, partial [Hyphomicrobiales bacterium]|nr:tripartite tricarboxylate transporter permease [Hyphomicrobiales bacterium]